MAPSEEYASRLAARELRVAEHEKIHIRLGNVRLLLALLTIVIGWLGFARHLFSPWWLAAPVAAFIAMAAYHSRVLRDRDLAQRSVSFYKKGLARVEDRWSGLGETGERFDDPHHVYASDLDLFGEGSLFQLISAARTRIGEEALAAWLLSPAPVEQVLQRQASVSELRGELDLREDLAVLGEDAGVGVHPDSLVKWAEAANQLQSSWIPRVAPVWHYWRHSRRSSGDTGASRLRSCSGCGRGSAEISAAQASGVCAGGDGARLPRSRSAVGCTGACGGAYIPLGSLAGVAASTLVERGAEFAGHRETEIAGRPHPFPRQLVSQSSGCAADVLGASRICRGALAARARQVGASMAGGGGEIEALLSLAGYSYEHPADPFPDFIRGHASFAAEQIGHPLIPAATCVRNDVAISGEERVLLVSGSNMSGKSTLLRAVGMNVVLAMAGGPVRATRLVLTPLHVGASIRINDSLREGSSRFYAEIKRLRSIFDFAGDPPLLFLLDELLQGTNSNDRRIGAEGVVHALLKRGAIGLISTHDLSLTEIGSSLNGHLHNVHLQDEIENGRMKFDYTLRDGVVTKSNGLELMRVIGLEV